MLKKLSVLALVLGLSLAATNIQQPRLRIKAKIGNGGGGGGGDNTAPLLTSSDFTYLGGCYPPSPAGFDTADSGAIITVNNISGTDYLYAQDRSGAVQEFTNCTDPNLSTSPPFNTGTNTQVFTDIYQNTICRHAGGTSAPPDTCGTANGVFPTSLNWINSDNKMYWTNYVGYETDGTSDYDLGIGRGTINRVAGTGLGEGMWAMAYRPNHDFPADTINDALVNTGNRWANGVIQIPTWFQAYTSGKTLALGWGNPSISTESVGPISYGLSLYAFSPTVLGSTTNLGIMGGANAQKLAAFPSGLAGNKRTSHGGVALYQVHDWANGDVLVDSSTDKVVWSDFGAGGQWIDGHNKQGIVVPYVTSAGLLDTTITATSAVNVFTLASVGDAAVGDLIIFQSDWTACNGSHYPQIVGFITSIVGNVVTVDGNNEFCGDYSTGFIPSTNRPLVGGWAHEGTQYLGGGSKTTRNYIVLYVYDPAQLKQVTLGTRLPSDVQPSSVFQLTLGGITQPFCTQTHGRAGYQIAITYSPTTKRMYMWAHDLWERSQNDNPAVIHVWQVGA